MELFTIGIAIISIIISVIGLVVSLWTTKVALNNQNKYSHIDYILEINKIIIADPVLLSIYDDKHPILATVEDYILVAAKQEAFCYYQLNVYEIIYDHYQISSRKRNRVAKMEWTAWEKTIENMIRCSPMFRKIISSQEIQSEYMIEFVSYLQMKLQTIQSIPKE